MLEELIREVDVGRGRGGFKWVGLNEVWIGVGRLRETNSWQNKGTNL